jgi:large subunit ribosomal protein L25
MKEQITIKVATRDEKGKGSARKLRSKKSIPAVLYGHKIDPLMLSIENSEMTRILKSGGDATLIKVQIDNKGKTDEKLVMIREVQRHPVKNNILHLDLFAVNVKEKIHAPVHIRLIGEAPGVKLGGILRQIVREIEVQALPTEIPQSFDIDVSGLEIGDSLHVSDLTIPDNVKVLAEEHSAIVNVLAPTVIKEDEPAEGEEGVAEGEGEGEGEGEETKETEKTASDSDKK